MSNISSIFTVFLVLVGVMLFGIWSNIYVYAQQPSSSPTLSTSSSPTGSSLSKPISPEVKAKMCDPSNPSLKVVSVSSSNTKDISCIIITINSSKYHCSKTTADKSCKQYSY